MSLMCTIGNYTEDCKSPLYNWLSQCGQGTVVLFSTAAAFARSGKPPAVAKRCTDAGVNC